MARTLSLAFATAMAAIAFTTAAHAQVRTRVHSDDSVGIRQVRSMQTAEPGQRKHAAYQAKGRAADRAKHNHRSYTVAPEPDLNSIMFRLAPYDFSWV
jgi:hypothetical protein